MCLPRAIEFGELHCGMQRSGRRMVMRGLAVTAALLLALPAEAEETSAWQRQKCALYTDAWTRALDGIGSDDINYNFLATNENFIASGCTEQIAICPRSNQERDIADLLTLVMMNDGAASTFLPFRCPTD
jgi:hypothetical protein